MSSKIPTGPRRTLCTVQAPVETTDELGQLVTTWSDVATFWAARLQTRGIAAENAKQHKEAAFHTLETAHHPIFATVTPQHRVLLPNGTPCGITRVDNLGDLDEHFVIWCVEVTPQQS